MAAFTGSLNANKIYSAIYNMIISQQVFSNPVDGGFMALVDKARVEGTMFGDQKLYYSTDALATFPFYPDNKDQLNVLKTHRNTNVKCQAITINKARQIPLTVDTYFSKQAFQNDSGFADFNFTLVSWLSDTKKIYDQTTYNTFIGTNATATGSQTQTVTLPADDTTPTNASSEANARRIAQTLGEALANIFDGINDVSKSYNDNGYLRSFSESKLRLVWNASWYNKILKIDLPTIFHKDGLINKFDEDRLPARYFGDVNTTAGTAGSSNTTVRSLYETWYYKDTNNDVVEVTDTVIQNTTLCPNGVDSIKDLSNVTHVFAGDLIPNSAKYGASRTYTENAKIICKIYVDGAVPYMSGFEVSTDFINGRGLTENKYLTFAHNTLEHLKEYPFVTVKRN